MLRHMPCIICEDLIKLDIIEMYKYVMYKSRFDNNY